MDIGTGDGAYVFRRAKAEPRLLHIGLDSNADGLAEISRKAAKKAQRGGTPNALFAVSAAEALPEALLGLATEITVLLPWGSLLRAVARPDPAVLSGLRGLCRAEAKLTVVLGYDPASEPGTADLPRLDTEHLACLVRGYRAAGFDVRVDAETDVRSLGTTWASRLAFGKPRPFFRITGWARP